VDEKGGLHYAHSSLRCVLSQRSAAAAGIVLQICEAAGIREEALRAACMPLNNKEQGTGSLPLSLMYKSTSRQSCNDVASASRPDNSSSRNECADAGESSDPSWG